jgi:hypothetical protein
VLSTNVVGYVRVIHAFLPLLERSENPRIINVSSGLGSFGRFHDEGRIESRFGSPLYGAANQAVLKAVYVEDGMVKHAEYTEVFAALFSRPSSNKWIKVPPAGFVPEGNAHDLTICRSGLPSLAHWSHAQ